jgi:multidrug resistance efflux pump
VKSLAQLEAASQDACDAHDKATADLDRVNSMIAALVLAEDHASDPALPVAVRRLLVARIDWTLITALKDEAAKMAREIDRLDTACHEAAHALNAAPEEAA